MTSDYKPNKENLVVDALSSNAELAVIYQLKGISLVEFESISEKLIVKLVQEGKMRRFSWLKNAPIHYGRSSIHAKNEVI